MNCVRGQRTGDAVKATAQHPRSVQRQPERIRSYFNHEPVRYAA